MHDLTMIGTTNARQTFTPFGIKQADRLNHLYIIGKTRTGKSTLLLKMMRQDIEAGRGFCLIDPHGDLVAQVKAAVPPEQQQRLIDFNVPDSAQPYGYNPLRYVHPNKRSLAASGMLEVMQRLWPDAWGVNMEHLLRHILLALLEVPGSTLPDIIKLLDDNVFRAQLIKKVTNSAVRRFWEHEYETYFAKNRGSGAGPILNKVGAFLADPTLRRVLTRPETDLHFRHIMDQGNILLVNLAKGQIGSDAAQLLGGLLVTTLGLAAFSRQDVPKDKRRNFFVYLDEFQSMTTQSVADMTAELRKYHVGLILAHQYLYQLDASVKEAVLGNAGTMIAFRLGAKDAAYLEPEFAPQFTARDLVSLPNHEVYLKLMVDGVPTHAFSATTAKY